ncbi:hypothetical protein B0H19DRAFT_1066626 [Mycena capillaripes]|nr:hypothetical protein B0H19DRAFT_1066626 [Mycena capillaripes]
MSQRDSIFVDTFVVLDHVYFEVKFYQLRTNASQGFYSSARRRIFKLDHFRSAGQTAPHIGLLTHWVLNDLALRRRLASGFHLWNSSTKSEEEAGTPVSPPESANSSERKALTRKPRMSHGISDSLRKSRTGRMRLFGIAQSRIKGAPAFKKRH